VSTGYVPVAEAECPSEYPRCPPQRGRWSHESYEPSHELKEQAGEAGSGRTGKPGQACVQVQQPSLSICLSWWPRWQVVKQAGRAPPLMFSAGLPAERVESSAGVLLGRTE